MERYLAAQYVVVEAQGRSQEVFEQFLVRKGWRRPAGLRTPHFMSLPMIICEIHFVTTAPLTRRKSRAQWCKAGDAVVPRSKNR